jgi:hypothetical protein
MSGRHEIAVDWREDTRRWTVIQYNVILHESTIYADAWAYADSRPKTYVDSDGNGYTFALEGDGCDHEREAFGNGTIIDCRDQDACATLFVVDPDGIYVEMLTHCITVGSAERQARKLARS